MRVSRRTALRIIAAMLVLDAVIFVYWLRRTADKERAFDRVIAECAERHGVPPSLVKSVIWRESAFDPRARGTSGEIGLMQVTSMAGEDWARAMGRDSFGAWLLWDPRHNVDIGTWYLARALRRWGDRDQPIPFALAEYNAGPTNARRWAESGTTARAFLAAIDYPTTRQYIHDVLERTKHYRRRGGP